MPWQVTGLNEDLKQNRASVSLNNQAGNDWLSVSVNFPVADADKQTEGDAEKRLRARTKQILLDAANSL